MPLYVTEYSMLAREDHGKPIATGQEPAENEFTITLSGTSAQSGQLANATRFVMVHTSEICHIAFGTNPTATTSHRRLPADATVFYGIKAGSELRIAAITGT